MHQRASISLLLCYFSPSVKFLRSFLFKYLARNDFFFKYTIHKIYLYSISVMCFGITSYKWWAVNVPRCQAVISLSPLNARPATASFNISNFLLNRCKWECKKILGLKKNILFSLHNTAVKCSWVKKKQQQRQEKRILLRDGGRCSSVSKEGHVCVQSQCSCVLEKSQM